MGGTENPLTCLLFPLIVLILEEVLVLMGENELVLIRAVASHLIESTEELLWTADPLVVEEGTLKLLDTTSWLFFTGGRPFGGVGSVEITFSEQDTNLCILNFLFFFFIFFFFFSRGLFFLSLFFTT